VGDLGGVVDGGAAVLEAPLEDPPPPQALRAIETASAAVNRQ
jgi:hypothetical protein